MTRLDQLRAMATAAELCDTHNLAEAEAIRLLWLMNGGRFPTQEAAQAQFPLLATQECRGQDRP